jgi:L-ascorbate metabolism protein UlaG (beta-lactamase superfamily)
MHPREPIEPIIASHPPFDNVDLILATHEHSDHFDPELVSLYLKNNPDTRFASNSNCVEEILGIDRSLGSRLTTIELSRGDSLNLTINNIDIEAIYLSHGIAGIVNIGFIITINNVILFHTGDMNPTAVRVFELEAYGLPEKQIDVAFIPYYLFSNEKYQSHILEGIQATYLIPMHFSSQPSPEFEDILPNIVLLTEPYEAWIVP